MRRGFTLVETLMALATVAILARFALPAIQYVQIRAIAASATGDVRLVRHAAIEFYGDTGAWPEDVVAGVVPPGLATYLPDGFTFERGRYQLDWDYYYLPDGLPDDPDTKEQMAVSVVTNDELLGQALIDLLGDTSVQLSVGDTYTFLLDDLGV